MHAKEISFFSSVNNGNLRSGNNTNKLIVAIIKWDCYKQSFLHI